MDVVPLTTGSGYTIFSHSGCSGYICFGMVGRVPVRHTHHMHMWAHFLTLVGIQEFTAKGISILLSLFLALPDHHLFL